MAEVGSRRNEKMVFGNLPGGSPKMKVPHWHRRLNWQIVLVVIRQNTVFRNGMCQHLEKLNNHGQGHHPNYSRVVVVLCIAIEI